MKGWGLICSLPPFSFVSEDRKDPRIFFERRRRRRQSCQEWQSRSPFLTGITVSDLLENPVRLMEKQE